MRDRCCECGSKLILFFRCRSCGKSMCLHRPEYQGTMTALTPLFPDASCIEKHQDECMKLKESKK